MTHQNKRIVYFDKLNSPELCLPAIRGHPTLGLKWFMKKVVERSWINWELGGEREEVGQRKGDGIRRGKKMLEKVENKKESCQLKCFPILFLYDIVSI